MGDCLLRRKQFAAAEPLLLEGWRGMEARKDLFDANMRDRLLGDIRKSAVFTAPVAGVSRATPDRLCRRAERGQTRLSSFVPFRRDTLKALEARHENGVLRPSNKLALRPGEQVNITIMRRPNPDRWDLARLAQSTQEESALTERGLVGRPRRLSAK